jgi:Holliday junction resolvase RusA-like endonuclease
MTTRPTVLGHLEFTATGDPVPQGSKRWLGARGMIDTNRDRLDPWREAIRTAAHHAMPEGWRPLEGPLGLRLWFALRAPKSRPKWRTMPDGRPDIDKLVRAVMDAMTSVGCWLDDAQVVRLLAVKVYDAQGMPRVTVSVRSIGDQAPGDEA